MSHTKSIPFKDAARTMELRIEKFYRQVAGLVPQGTLRDLLTFLADEEAAHAESIDGFDARATTAATLDRAFADAGPIMGFLLAGVEKTADLASTFTSEDQIFEFAIQCEKDVMVFYQTLARYVPEGPVAAQVERLVGWEIDHMNQLSTLWNIHREAKAAAAERDPG